MSDWNGKIISEFRKNHGRVGGYFVGSPILLLHTTGRLSGKERVNPLVYLKDGDRYVIFASKGGADTNPDWYHNLRARPDVQVEIGDEKIDMTAVEALGSERDGLYRRQAESYPSFADYELKTKRTIPVIILSKKKA